MNTTFPFVKNFTKITTLDMHTGGEPLRVTFGISCDPKHYAEIIPLGKLIKKRGN